MTTANVARDEPLAAWTPLRDCRTEAFVVCRLPGHCLRSCDRKEDCGVNTGFHALVFKECSINCLLGDESAWGAYPGVFANGRGSVINDHLS
jgi:hypothetical protein